MKPDPLASIVDMPLALKPDQHLLLLDVSPSSLSKKTQSMELVISTPPEFYDVYCSYKGVKRFEKRTSLHCTSHEADSEVLYLPVSYLSTACPSCHIFSADVVPSPKLSLRIGRVLWKFTLQFLQLQYHLIHQRVNFFK